MNNLALISHVFENYLWQALFSVALVSIPIAIWIFIFTRHEKESRGVVLVSFMAGIGSAFIMFVYQHFWEVQLDFGFFELTPVNFQKNISAWTTHRLFSVFLVAMSIGLIEEYLKHWVVKKADHNFFTCVNDVIQLSIVAALGFAFTENIIYLFREFTSGGFSPKFFSLFFLRSLFVVFVHVLCSGIYGYYYGVSYYAKPILEEEQHEGRKHWIPNFLHRFVHLKKFRVFHDEMVALGLLIAMTVHGVFDFFMSVNWTLGDIFGIESLEKIGIHMVVLPAYLIFGFAYLWHLLSKKRDHEKFGRLSMEPTYIGERTVYKNLEKLKDIEDAVEENYKHRMTVKQEEQKNWEEVDEDVSLDDLMSEEEKK